MVAAQPTRFTDLAGLVRLSGGRAPAFAGPSLLVVTGRGAHSPGGASTVRADVHRVLEARGVPFDVANDGAVEIPLPD